jgi:cation transport ATPase
MKRKNTMNKIKENLAILFGVVFVMSMVGATGAVEADNYLVGFVMALVGISTGILTIILQSKEDY